MSARGTVVFPVARRVPLLVRFLSILLGLALPSVAHAQANFESGQLGGRTSMMGGAAVVSGEDEATAFVNPAGITRIVGQSLSFSTFTTQLSGRSVKNSLDPSNNLQLENASSTQLSLRIVPNTFCLFLDGPPMNQESRRSRHKYALCAAATEREAFDFTQNEVGTTSGVNVGAAHSTRMEFTRSTLALAWGIKLDRDTSLGTTLRVDNATLEDTTSASAFSATGTTGTINSLSHALDAWSWDTSITVGLTSNLSRVVAVGASMTTPSQHLLGYFAGNSSLSTSATSARRITTYNGDFRYNHPGSLKLGLAFTWPRLVFEVDGSFYGPQRNLARVSFDQTETEVNESGVPSTTATRSTIIERGRPVTNLSVGAEYFIERDFSLVTGVQTDFSGMHRRSETPIDEVLFRQAQDTIHAAVGLSSYGSAGRLLLGLRGHYSVGTILIADPTGSTGNFVDLPQTEWGLSLLVSGRISFRTVRDTAARAADSLTPDGKSDEKEKP